MTTQPIRKVGVFLRHDQPEAAGTLRSLLKWLSERELEVAIDENCARWADLSPTPESELAASVDLIVVLGGDGTLLHVAHCAGTRRVPILGINLGTLGFLTEINVEEMIPALERVLAGDVEVKARMRLEVVATRGERELGRYHALNDAVIAKSGRSSMIQLDTIADGLEVTTYHADGLIVSTPTGSTAYSLSAGGPILVPGTEVMLVTPICPHALTQRPLVLPESSQLEVCVETRGAEVGLTIDGQANLDLEDGDRVFVHRSPHPVEIISSPFRNRFEILRAKLRWGER